MAEPTPFRLSQLFSQLIGRKVVFTQTTAALESKIRQMYGIYTVPPHEVAIVVKADPDHAYEVRRKSREPAVTRRSRLPGGWRRESHRANRCAGSVIDDVFHQCRH